MVGLQVGRSVSHFVCFGWWVSSYVFFWSVELPVGCLVDLSVGWFEYWLVH